MYEKQEDVFYYITIYNENILHPAMPEGVEEGIVKGLYRLRPAETAGERRVQLFGSGSIMQSVLAAQQLLAERFEVAADVWSAPSYQQLRNEALSVDRWNRLHPEAEPRRPYVAAALEGAQGPVIAATDYMKAVPDMIRPWVGRQMISLGTDGFGRSDTREALRRFFEVDAESIAAAALYALSREGKMPAAEVAAAITELGIDPEKPDPLLS
jgi:pyruvate dehydrogenase E1 component